MSMIDELVREIMSPLSKTFDAKSLRAIEQACYCALDTYNISKEAAAEMGNSELAILDVDYRTYQMFFVAKKIEGLSIRSLQVYKYVLDAFMDFCKKPLNTITSNDVRVYMAVKSKDVTPVSLDNIRRYLSSFFNWLFVEEYISKNPMLKIKAVKAPKVVRQPFSGQEIEELRDACKNTRERAIVEILLSTGMRVGELAGVNRGDVSGAEIMVTGKGNKQRVCYLNPAAAKRLSDYLVERDDSLSPLIIAEASARKSTEAKSEYRLGISGLEALVREIGRRAGVANTHPHRFRRTAATMALQRGMPIDQVRMMLGHESMETTLRYAVVADNTVKHSHSKYM